MKIKLLGVRGSTPATTSACRHFGHHTPCIQIQHEETLLFLDAGTGISTSQGGLKPPDDIHVFFTHYHLDHLIGLPFNPLFWSSQKNIHFWGPVLSPNSTIEQALTKLFTPPFFPIPLKKWGSKLHFHTLTPGEDSLIGSLTITAHTLQHPGGAVGYRVSTENSKRFAYITDVEHGDGASDQNILKLMDHADLALFDAMFDDKTYKNHTGWGHSTWEKGIDFAQQASLKSLGLMHHSPSATDTFLQARENEIKKHMPEAFAAREGMTFDFK